MKPIYTPKARAKEYGDLAINIYAGMKGARNEQIIRLRQGN